MNNLDNEIKRIITSDITPHRSFDSRIYETFEKLEKSSKRHFNYILATVSCSVLLIAGIVFAKEIEEFIHYKFYLSDGVNTAIDNGYIAEPQTDYIEDKMIMTDAKTGEFIDEIPMKIKLKSAFMDDRNIGIEFACEFDIKIDDYVDLGKLSPQGFIDYENSHTTNILDIIVKDEEDRLLNWSGETKEDYIIFCNEHNLNPEEDVAYSRWAHTLMGEGSIYRDDKTLKLTLESTLTAIDTFPKSKKLYVSFSKIELDPKGEGQGTGVYLKSEKGFEFEVELPEEIYERTEISYEQVKSEREDVRVVEAILSNTRLEVLFEIDNIAEPEYPKKMLEIESLGMGNYDHEKPYPEGYGEEYAKLYKEYYNKLDMIRPDGHSRGNLGEPTEGCYVLDSNGNRFKWDEANGTERSYIDGAYKYKMSFTMTKYDATDRVTVVLDIMGEPVKIYLKMAK